MAARAASAFSFVSSREVQGEGQAARYRREGAAAAAIATAAQVEHIIMMGVTFATVVLIIRLAVPGEDLHDFYPGGGRDDNMIGFFNAHDCKVAAASSSASTRVPSRQAATSGTPSSTNSGRSSARPAGQTHEPHLTKRSA